IGDRAVEAVLDGLEMIIGDSGNPLRHRIEHNAVVRPEMRDRYDEVGAVAVIFGSFGACAYLGRDERFRFSTPIENQEWEWPWRDIIDQNPTTVFAWHGDYPVFHDSGPIASLYGFVTRAQTLPDGTHCEPEPYHSKHAITVEEALETMTMGSAYALDRESEVGSLAVGKLADFVVLSADPRVMPVDQLLDLEVEMTVFDGVPVHCSGTLAPPCSSSAQTSDPNGLTASASLADHPPDHAVDGDQETHWGSGADAPQWIEIPLPEPTPLTSIQLVVDQFPAGPTTHVISGRTEDGSLVEIATITGTTEMFDTIEITVDDQTPLAAVRVETTVSPSWVAWREIRIEPSG
ncbi:MAG: amidohydrolase family protein, partial [Serratia inhibens]|uniref:discoidin domain-containing protein n=1 Tax=Serratia inhibens TaxID=2338073 RepID=UPI003C7AAD8D